MPSWNQARFLAQTLDSALAQTFRSFEIVLVDDSSTDGTLALARSYEKLHPSTLHVYSHVENAHRGISASTNLAISKSAGEFIVILDSDDLWHADTLDRRVTFMRANPAITLACSHYDIIDEHGNTTRRRAAPDISRICQSPVGLLHSMIMGCVIGNPTVIVRRSCLAELEPLDEDLVHGDWEIWTRLTANHPVGFIPESTALHRRHKGNVTGSHSIETELQRRLAVMRALDGKAPATGGAMTAPVIRALIHLEICSLLFCLYQRDEAARHLALALQYNPHIANDGGVYFRTWLAQRPIVEAPRADFHAWISAWFAHGPTISPTREMVSLQGEQRL